MIINVIGSNFTGKTTLIQESLACYPAMFLDIRTYRESIDGEYYRRHPNGIGPWQQQLQVLFQYPQSMNAWRAIFRHGGPSLAHRYWKYFFIHVMLLKGIDGIARDERLIFLDEGVVKKLYEAVPWLDLQTYPYARQHWMHFVIRTSPMLVQSLRGLADRIVYIWADPVVLIERARQRDDTYLRQIGEEALLRRYRLQHELYRYLLDQIQASGIPVLDIETTDPASAQTAWRRFLARSAADQSPAA